MTKRCSNGDYCKLPPKRVLFDRKECHNTKGSIGPNAILIDVSGKYWRLGKRIGTGGFGTIFLASDIINKNVGEETKYICKIEEHHNGPLFVERNLYLRIGKLDMIEKWKTEHDVKSLGMPYYVASGSHTIADKKYRFLIIPKYDCDLQQVFANKSMRFNIKTVCLIGIQLINVLEYIHDNGYIHGDVKAPNIVLNKRAPTMPLKTSPYKSGIGIRYLGRSPLRACRLQHAKTVKRTLRSNALSTTTSTSASDVDTDQIYLLDYGLAAKYFNADGTHKSGAGDQRKAHAGTIMFCSIDAHRGIASRRSDLECLGYNLIYWLTGSLPWEANGAAAAEPETIEQAKADHLQDVDAFLRHAFKNDGRAPTFVYDYFDRLTRLGHCDRPDYDRFRRLFQEAIVEYGYKDDNQFDFDGLEKCTRRVARKSNAENGRVIIKNKKAIKKKKMIASYAFYCHQRMPLRATNGAHDRRIKTTKKKNNGKVGNWSNMLTDPEQIIKRLNHRQRVKRSPDMGDVSVGVNGIQMLDIRSLNPTPAMLKVYERSMRRMSNNNNSNCKGDIVTSPIEGYTEAMMDVHLFMEQQKEQDNEQKTAVIDKLKRTRNKKTIKTMQNCKTINYTPIITRSISQHITRSELKSKLQKPCGFIYRLKY